jgi:hypothetical protein
MDTENSLSEDDRQYVAEVLSSLAKMSQLSCDFDVEVKLGSKEIPA